MTPQNGHAAATQAPPHAQPAKPLADLGGFLDDRFRGAKGMRSFFRKIFPDHWSFMLGEIALPARSRKRAFNGFAVVAASSPREVLLSSASPTAPAPSPRAAGNPCRS